MRRIAFVMLALALAGCSDDGDETSPDTTDPPSAAADFSFRPVLEVRAADDCGAGDADHLRDVDDETCYELGPPPVERVTFESAEAGLDPAGTTWIVNPVLTDDETGIDALNELADPCFVQGPTCPTGQVAMVLDGEVLTAPTIQDTDFAPDRVIITGDFTQEEAEDLADRLSP